MRIGELSVRTGASRRSLRHYESAGLVRSTRLANGYRDYDVSQVEQVGVIRDLLAAGLSLDAIAVVAPCRAAGQLRPHCQRAADRVEAELARLDARAAEIDTARRRLRQLL